MAVFLDTQNGSSSIIAAQPNPDNNSLFITLPSGQIWMSGSDASSGQARRQQAIYALLARARYSREEIESLYSSLARIAAQAHALRDVEAADLASQIMLALPVSSRAKNVARYYQACCIKRKGDFEGARQRLDQLLEHDLDPLLRSRALLTKGATHFDAGEIDRALPFYIETGQIARDCELATLVKSLRQIAVIKAMHGDHHEAAADLESLASIVSRLSGSRSIHDRLTYCEVLNSYAVELGEIGRAEQALNVASRITPFAAIHPEFNVTIAELRSKLPTRKRSVVVIHRTESLAEPRANPNRTNHRIATLACMIGGAERRFTSYRAPPATRGRFTTTITARNPAREPAKPRAP